MSYDVRCSVWICKAKERSPFEETDTSLRGSIKKCAMKLTSHDIGICRVNDPDNTAGVTGPAIQARVAFLRFCKTDRTTLQVKSR